MAPPRKERLVPGDCVVNRRNGTVDPEGSGTVISVWLGVRLGVRGDLALLLTVEGELVEWYLPTLLDEQLEGWEVTLLHHGEEYGGDAI